VEAAGGEQEEEIDTVLENFVHGTITALSGTTEEARAAVKHHCGASVKARVDDGLDGAHARAELKLILKGLNAEAARPR
jgi:hypothetical protein